MLEPLNSERLDALLRDDNDAGCEKISAARYFFEKQDLAQGVEALLQAFKIFNPYLIFEEKDGLRDWNDWHIKFYDPLFDTLYLRPCGGTIEIFICDKFVIAYGILGRPQNWVRMLQWIWAYGDEVYITNVKKGSMLRPLDYRKLDMLVEDDNDADCDSIRCTKVCLGKEKDLARGIVCLFEGWKVFVPHIHRNKEVENSWQVTFRDSPFRSLRIQPSTDHGVVDLYAFDKYVRSFHILNNPHTSDRDMWQRLLRLVWDYGKRRLEHKKRWEEMQRLSPRKHDKSQSKSKRTEKPLLHKVLHTAGFKAQRGAHPRARSMVVVPDKEDDVMEDVDAGIHVEKSTSRQLFIQKSALVATGPNARLGTSWKMKDNIGIHDEKSKSCQLFIQKSALVATDPNARLGTSWKMKDTGNSRTTKVEVDNVNIGGLEIMDC